MKTIEGTYTFANIFTTNNEVHAIEDYALAQIQMICDQEASKNCRIRVMPDVHPGKVGPIGLTQTLGDKIILNLVGIDIALLRSTRSLFGFCHIQLVWNHRNCLSVP